jgi:hypothetical protein
MRRLLAALALCGVCAGMALGQSTRFVAPSLVFDDSAFNYAGDLTGSLTFVRNMGTNTLKVTLVPGEVEGGLRFTTTDADRAAVVGIDRSVARAVIGIDVSDRGIELPFDLASVDPYDVLSYFHQRLPALGFEPSQELFGGNAYVFTCSCQENRMTGARLSLDRTGKRAFVRLVLELPTAY